MSFAIFSPDIQAQDLQRSNAQTAGHPENKRSELDRAYKMSPPEQDGPPRPERCIVDDPGNRTHWLGAVMAFGAMSQYGAEYSYSVWQRADLKKFNCNYAHMSVGLGGFGLRKKSEFRGGFPYVFYEAKGTFLWLGASIQPRLGLVIHGDEVTPAAALSTSLVNFLFVEFGYTIQLSLGTSQPSILGQHMFHIDLNIPIANGGTLFPNEPE